MIVTRDQSHPSNPRVLTASTLSERFRLRITQRQLMVDRFQQVGRLMIVRIARRRVRTDPARDVTIGFKERRRVRASMVTRIIRD